ncbi:protein PLASTID MOVEMENT IMPAIRED 1-RELATED 1 isoform X2 [Cryptomeria japonica]|uniref:protein PLASTID MOVEMENT IMPAIRED 1-RELATED 1 isoform X2 n=1 Tax=Cryptomeria japonica TaxID=3369 RepID=UPI0027DA86E3|nr:protein PLASTID MOVEMENT IMPAIRED 1-RELATED 1 isoform X2 [Cryptomeria japonica]
MEAHEIIRIPFIRPCRIINGTADIDETLQLHSTVTCSSKIKHGCNIWVSVCGVEMGGTAFSTHCLDLSRLVPQGPCLASSSSWATTLKLTGKTKGALLVATFACQLVRDVGGDSHNDGLGQSRVCTTPQSEVQQSKSPSVSDLDLNEVPSLKSLGLEEDRSLTPAAEAPKLEFANQKRVSCDESNCRVLLNAKSESSSEIRALLLENDTNLASTSSQLPSMSNLDSSNGGNKPTLNSSWGDDDVMFSVVEQGVEVEYSAVEQGLGMETLSTRGLQEEEMISSENTQPRVDCDWWEGREDTYRGFQEHMQVIEEELARLEARLDANDCWEEKLQVTENCNTEDVLEEKLALHESHAEASLSDKNMRRSSFSVDGKWKIEEGLGERLCLIESCIVEDNLKESQNQLSDRTWEQSEEDKEKLEERFLNEIQGYALEKQMVNCNSDEDIDSVTDEFLNLLERGHNASDVMPRREVNSLCTLFQREYELDVASQITLDSGVEVDKEMQASFMDNLEMEMQKNEQVLRSKTRAKILEDAETQALMQEWGLNENAFELSSPKSNCLSASSGLMRNLIFSPALERGIGSVVQTRDGGYIRSMNPRHFVNSKIGGKLVMHVSKPLVMSAEMGSTAIDILRRMAATGMDTLASQAMVAMPLEDIAGKTIEQVMLEGSSALEGLLHEADRNKSSGRGYTAEKSESDLSVFSSDDTPITNRVKLGFEKEGYKSGERNFPGKSTKDFLDGYVSAEDLAPLAMQKIEALALEGLKIQSDMADEDAPYHVDSLPLVDSDNGDTKIGYMAEIDQVASINMLASKEADESTNQVVGTMSSAISFQKWMEINARFSSENGAHTTYAIKADQVSLNTNAKKNDSRRKRDDSRSNCVNKTITITMLVQLRDPLRNFEPVGPPMIALIQTERVIKSPRPKLSKQVSTRTTDELEEDEVEDQKDLPIEPQFKITEVHMAGLKAPKTEEKKGWFFQKWGSKKQEQAGSRWLIANGMTKNNKPAPLKSKALPIQSKTTVVQPGETLWSISSRVHGTGSKWQEIASLNPHIRNPDIIFPNQTIRTK